ncbi:helix-turn-helix transcriptional regulator [Blautia marasmi]|uniref:helix-turn-helix transcriptional regulator n=1 Tax=Blautia marasmi TaxID=1917868 RepID=UPI000CF29538|nr:helix-turn-helix transcriptional regulator [Blautia marasmi]
MDDIIYAFPKIKNIDPSCYIDAYNLILECSNAHSPRSFAVRFLELAGAMCAFDRAFVFFLDANGEISGEYTINIQDQWVDEYLNYYLECEKCPPQFSIKKSMYHAYELPNSRIIKWSDVPKSEFLTNYIHAQKLTYSWGFSFFDLNGKHRVVFSLDRIQDKIFSEIEINRLQLALPILNNMYRNFYYQGTDNNARKGEAGWTEYNFTKREFEIVNLLCQGMSIRNISSALYIAKTTTYKHISHIYEKVGVSSQKDLLFKLMNL